MKRISRAHALRRSGSLPMVAYAAFLVAAAAVALGGCATTSPAATATTAPGGNAAAASVSALEAALTGAGQAVLACYATPACAAVAPKPQIKTAYDTAYTTVTAAQSTADLGGTPDLTAATAAMSALAALLGKLPPTTPAAATPAPTT